MRVLVIGGSGHVGSLVLPYLAEHHDLAVFDLKPPIAGVEVEYLPGDLRDVAAVRRSFDGIDALVFMAMGPLSGWGSPENAQAHLDVAVPGLYAALAAAHDAGVDHAVYTSSMSVFALRYDGRAGTHGTEDGAPVGTNDGAPAGPPRYPDESTPPDATDFYGLAKRLGEEVCRNAVAAWGMSVVALRLCHPTADAEFPRTESPIRQTICTSARDTAAAILAGLEYRGHGFEAFGISGDAAGRTVSIRKAGELLGWQPLDRTT
ncbi:NAD(P)-dependent oxidoreductase [Actinopolymorpha sp. B17G11]|uniref:NAD-dependent epimerase/dehydratase family protein n=1 Tax=Actinopolymorpha sp. B17G11 TaxID=3160861 RepID=UPI0032E465D9